MTVFCCIAEVLKLLRTELEKLSTKEQDALQNIIAQDL
jgi:hypothetical protein